MITEDYVDFETAKLLKEKGFHEPCIATYNLTTKDFAAEKIYQDWTTCWKTHVSAPTHQMACKWLREVHNKHCDIGYDIDLGWLFQIIDLKEVVEYDYPEIKYYHAENETGFNSYEEACEAALKYVLENLV